MATAYAAFVSLMNILSRIQHPSCPAFFDQLQIQTLFDKVRLIIDFLEENDAHRRDGKLTEDLVFQLKNNAALEAGDLIESYIVDKVHAKSEGTRGRDSDLFYQDIQRAIQEIDVVMQHVMELKEKICAKTDQLPRVSTPVGSLASTSHEDTMVGFDEDLKHLLVLLTADQSERGRIIPIVGMGGIGKTTLATNVYNHPRIVKYFNVRGWVTISQNYNVQEVIIALLRDFGVHGVEAGNKEELQLILHQHLMGNSYIIMLDDIWSDAFWGEISLFFPKTNGSKILLTSRLLNVIPSVEECTPYKMKFLDEGKSWNLLCQKVFGEEQSPPELKDSGMSICRSCKGLPLAIVVMAGVLKTYHKTQEYWGHVANNLYSMILSMQNDENYLSILSLSYNHLPIHLKPCFLGLVCFPQGQHINATRLIRLWIANGFLKPNAQNNLEEIALQCLKDLINRNLITVNRRGSDGKIEWCIIHDLLADLGRREAQIEGFLNVLKNGLISREQKLITHNGVHNVCSDMPIIQSVAQSLKSDPSMQSKFVEEIKLLHVLYSHSDDSLQTVLQLYNARFLCSTRSLFDDNSRSILSLISLLWNLETLIVEEPLIGVTPILPSEIWELPHLSHVEFKKVILSDPVDVKSDCVLSNFHTLSTVVNFSGSNEVVKRIPNLRKLGVYYDILEASDGKVSNCFSNLAHLYKLETLECAFNYDEVNRVCAFSELDTLTLPCNLQKLSLSGCHIPWENMTVIGSLPNLEVLTLEDFAFFGKEWYSNDGEFKRLTFLSIKVCNLETWFADGYQFPKLEHLQLKYMPLLKEIPSSIGVASLMSIELIYCEGAAMVSAKEMLDELKDMGNDVLLIQVTPYPWNCNSEIMSLKDDRFQILTPTPMDDPSNDEKDPWDRCRSGWDKLLFRMYDHILSQANVLASEGYCFSLELEEMVMDFSNYMVQYLLNTYGTGSKKKDALITLGTSIVDSLIDTASQARLAKDVERTHESKFAALHNDPSEKIIQLMRDKIVLNIENQITSAGNTEPTKEEAGTSKGPTVPPPGEMEDID